MESADLYRLRSVGDVQLSADGRRVAYSVVSSEGPGRPAAQIMIMTVRTGAAVPLGTASEGASHPR